MTSLEKQKMTRLQILL